MMLARDKRSHNQDKSAARLCHHATAGVPDMFCNFYLVKSHKIANNSAATEARKKISTDLESFECSKIFDVCLP